MCKSCRRKLEEHMTVDYIMMLKDLPMRDFEMKEWDAVGKCFIKKEDRIQLVINLLKILCTNAAWQRLKLGKILQDWRVSYTQLELAFKKEFRDISSTLVDEYLCDKISKHILVWVKEQTYWIASRFLVFRLRTGAILTH